MNLNMSPNQPYSLNSEYKPLKSVLLYKPGPEIGKVDEPTRVLHKDKIDYQTISLEFQNIFEVFHRLKIDVYFIEPPSNNIANGNYLYNMMYCRDLIFMTPGGAIISKMAYEIRKEEVHFAKKALRRIGVPILKNIDGRGTFEGADALWVNNKLVIVGVGNRTNNEGYRQICDQLKSMDVGCLLVPSTQKVTQHLLGVLQFVDFNLALVRVDLIDEEIIDILKTNKIKVISIPENEEIKNKQAMNIVCVAPRQIIMTAGCPETKKIYQSAGVTIAAEVRIDQLINGGGGLACATAPLSRQING